MASLGVLFALTEKQTKHLMKAHGDEEVLELIEEIEEAWDKESLQETDMAWDAIHRCLSDGSLNPEAGTYPFNMRRQHILCFLFASFLVLLLAVGLVGLPGVHGLRPEQKNRDQINAMTERHVICVI